ncbi:MAG TPA: L,D-transpeptidase [Gemmatimonadaceae bacterium]|jgi:lipoprotein-anchoring transpeptidase ErfK/SrfK
MHSLRSNKLSKRTRAITGTVALSALTLIGLGAARRGNAAAVSTDPVAHLEADLSARKLKLYDGDSLVATYSVAVGKDSKPTPPGQFSIHRIVWNPAWIPPDEPWAKGKKPQAPGAAANPMKLVKIFFKEPDYYIHGTNEPESLGEAESHGCLRMDPDDAYRVARFVMENGGQPRDESWFERVLHFRSETKTVMLDTPIALTITE